MAVVAGVDGCRGGWVAAYVDCAGDRVRFVEFRVVTSLGDVVGDDRLAAIAVDIPIGLPGSTGSRACDVEARRLLSPHGARVFPAPVRTTLDHVADYAMANAASRASCGKGLPKQAWNILGKIADADAFALDPRLVECHPEVAFALMGDGVIAASKKTADGRAQRRARLEGWLGKVPPTPSDDHLDALACAWTAMRVLSGAALALGDGEVDAEGRPMRIVA